MQKVFNFLLIIFCIFVIAYIAFLLYVKYWPERNFGEDELEAPGIVEGIVTDDPKFLEEGVLPQTYSDAEVHFYKAVESGRYKLGEGDEEKIDYEIGEKVEDVRTSDDGDFFVELPPGKYFGRAFYQESSHSQEEFFEIKKGEKKKIDFYLIHPPN